MFFRKTFLNLQKTHRAAFSFAVVMLCTACSTSYEAEEQTVSAVKGTYAVASVSDTSDPTCAENYGSIVGHLEYLMAQKNSGQAAVSP
jgi:hypothetical protein